jgi:hypothetical protein
MEQAGVITITLFLIGVVFALGQASSRLKSLEQWRAEVRDELKEIRAGINEVKSLIRGEEV